MNKRQSHGVKKLTAAMAAADKKLQGISEDSEKIKEKLKAIMDAVNYPVPNRVIDDE